MTDDIPDSSTLGAALWRAGLLGNLHDAAVAIGLCIQGWEPEGFFASHMARRKAMQCLRTVVASAIDLPVEVKNAMPRIDWEAIEALKPHLRIRRDEDREQVWEALQNQVPAMLVELSRYRRQLPQLFAFDA
ncbi:hypothetical protein GPA19_09100 [Azoarcus indigens]|uniref:Uncharacterized protein n=1 Tax=Azoarcus indigens TaxID=29545 RepID=A0A4R6DV13_9RHOO|nr:hypothetical protein [Azoarcus indigens]NMG65104.1 hypothetical protein [Azoarcus indigens]TDN48997.1 hypothetical protein C7389_113120 [Azoarcus indigens]